MKVFAMGWVVCVLLGLSSEALCQGRVTGGVIHFQGSIVERSCESGRKDAVDYGANTRIIDVAPDVVLAVNMAGSICRHGDIPFVTSYQAFGTAGLDNTATVRRGVLTISYR